MQAQQELLVKVADRLWQMQEELIADLVQATRAQIAVLDRAGSRSLMEASFTENVVVAINFLRQEFDADLLDAPTAALAYARVLAQRDVPLSALIRAYRIGHGRFLDHVFAFLDDMPAEERLPVVVEFVRRSAQFIDQICEQVGRTYERERDRWVASQSGVRQQWVNELLGGGPVDRAAAERVLQYPLQTVHVACVLWPVGRMTSFDLVTAVDDVRAHAVAMLKAHASLVVPTDEHEARLWLALPAPSAGRLEEFALPEGSPLHIAFGRPGPGLTGFRTSARQAGQVKEILATRLSTTKHRGPGPRRSYCVRYTEVAPVALMAADVPALGEFVTSVLGDLAKTGGRNAVLRETLQTFLAHHRSHTSAAEAMSLHRNSVQYRVQQATTLLPRGADSLEDDFNVRAALLAADWLGSAVLDRIE